MTEPARVGDVMPGVLAEVVDRAGAGYEALRHEAWGGALLRVT